MLLAIIVLTGIFPSLVKASAVGDAAPACLLSSLDGKPMPGLADLKGKVLYVDFWASWCGPCAKSFVFLNEMHRRLEKQGLRIIGINLDEDISEAKAFLANNPADFAIASDKEGLCAKSFELKAMPSSYLIDASGQIQHIHLGFRAEETDQLLKLIEKLVEENNRNHK